MGYAPATDPQVAIAVLIEGGLSGGKVAAPIARRVLEGLRAKLPPPAPLAPAPGHFRTLEEVK